DSPDTAESLAFLLRREGHTVHTAYSGPAALAEAAALRPEVVVLDIGLPGMDGYEVARRLREQSAPGERLLLIALTGLGAEADRRRAQAAGFDHHLTKPVELADIVTLFANLGPPP